MQCAHYLEITQLSCVDFNTGQLHIALTVRQLYFTPLLQGWSYLPSLAAGGSGLEDLPRPWRLTSVLSNRKTFMLPPKLGGGATDNLPHCQPFVCHGKSSWVGWRCREGWFAPEGWPKEAWRCRRGFPAPRVAEKGARDYSRRRAEARRRSEGVVILMLKRSPSV